MNLRSKNVSPIDRRKFVKLKTSQEFKAVSGSYKERRRKQIPHTCSRKGMVRLAEEMKTASGNPSEVTRLKVWMKSRTRKDGTPVNTNAAEKMKKAAELVDNDTPPSTTNEGEDSLTLLLGPNNPGRMRVLGRNMNKTKLACFQVQHRCMTEMEEKQVHLQQKVKELEDEIAKMKNQRQEPEVGENSAAKSVNKRSQPKCVLVDWAGPTDVKVFVDSATKPDAFLWRHAKSVEEAVDITPLGHRASSINKCKLLDLSSDEIVVAEGRWQTEEPKALVNGLPLGLKAVKVFVDVVHEPETFIWRPTVEAAYIEDCLMSFVAWPASKVVFENSRDGTGHKSRFQNSTSADQTSDASGSKSLTQTSLPGGSQSAARVSKSATEKSAGTHPVIKENHRCKMMDISGRKVVVAEGRVHSTDPEQKVHFVRLGHDAARVWVDIVKVDDAAVWKPSDEIETMKDAHGSSIAWPMEKLVIF
ncbi:unnamed protein product [Microthlaspi erraticum]|uniref:DUF8039 domain-containing protein n=1 Tax=Microthlaspi erraticum TaxID=1685480 RepID=A0A6D2HK06_9BRAS|nr:unnamed protein product [Microthlaspi erraticum]